MSRKKLRQNENFFGIGQRIRQVRENKGLSQESFAEILGIKRGAPSISEWETGQVEPGITLICKVEKEFKIDLHWLLTGEPYAPDSQEASISEKLNDLIGIIKSFPCLGNSLYPLANRRNGKPDDREKKIERREGEPGEDEHRKE